MSRIWQYYYIYSLARSLCNVAAAAAAASHPILSPVLWTKIEIEIGLRD
jgi:hypothetical protein